MRTDILIVTYQRDLEYLKVLLESIRRHAGDGFGECVVAIPEPLVHHIALPPGPLRLYAFDERQGKGMLHQQVMKCRADEICPEADAILHLDADCMFWDDFSAADFFVGRRARIVSESYDEILNHHRKDWRLRVERATGLWPIWEGMTCHPHVYFRETYKKLRERVEQHTSRGFDDYVFSCQNEFPQGFAEFPTLCAVACEDFASRYDLEWYDRKKDAAELGLDPKGNWQYAYRRGRDKLVEFWSHTPIALNRELIRYINSGEAPEVPFVLK